MRTELLAVDFEDAHKWVGDRLVWRGTRPRKTDWSSWGDYQYRGKTHYVAAHRVKSVCNPWA
ncbi:MAG: hypothetical protein M3P11_05155 [Actinomycetota bacterium]|nr:hypothetical protein [Actinomycetota bacterium]